MPLEALPDTPATLAGADPTRRALTRLRARLPDLHVTGEDEPPYPACVVTDPPGQPLGTARHIVTTTLQVELWDDAAASTGRAALKGLAYDVVAVLAELPLLDPSPLEPVITNVDVGSIGWSPTGGRGRYLTRVTITSHPPLPA